MTKLPDRPTRILIADDSSLARRILRRFLEEMGHSVDEATDGEQAVAQYTVHRHDLVILDLVMVGMYGLDALAKIRALNPEVPVIVATADIQQSTTDQVHAVPGAAIINKPVTRRALAELVSNILEGKAACN